MSDGTVENPDVETPPEGMPAPVAPDRPSGARSSKSQSDSVRHSMSLVTPTYRATWVTVLLAFLQACVVALLATSMAGLPDAEDIGNVMQTHNTLSHFDYQTVGMNEAQSQSGGGGPSFSFAYDMQFTLKYASSRTTYIYNGATQYDVVSTFTYSPCNKKTMVVANSLGDDVNIHPWLALDNELDLCSPSNDGLAMSCSKWGESASGYFAVAFVLAVANLFLIFGQALALSFEMCGMPFTVALNWMSLAGHGLAFCFVSATYGFSTNCVGGFADLAAEKKQVGNLKVEPKVEFQSGEIYGVAGTAIAFLVLQMLLCVYFRYPTDKKEERASTAEALRRASGIAPPAPPLPA